MGCDMHVGKEYLLILIAGAGFGTSYCPMDGGCLARSSRS